MSGNNPAQISAEARQAKLDEADRLDWIAKHSRDPDMKAHFIRLAREVRLSAK